MKNRITIISLIPLLITLLKQNSISFQVKMTPANIFIEEENISKNIEGNRITESKSTNPNYFVYKPIVDLQTCKIYDLPFTNEEKFTDGHFSKFKARLIYDIKNQSEMAFRP